MNWLAVPCIEVSQTNKAGKGGGWEGDGDDEDEDDDPPPSYEEAFSFFGDNPSSRLISTTIRLIEFLID